MRLSVICVITAAVIHKNQYPDIVLIVSVK